MTFKKRFPLEAHLAEGAGPITTICSNAELLPASSFLGRWGFECLLDEFFWNLDGVRLFVLYFDNGRKIPDDLIRR